MHLQPPPKKTLKRWLSDDGTVEGGGTFGHLLLEQDGEEPKNLLDDLKAYFESAHADEREHFHDFIGISLHPDDEPSAAITYPKCLPPIAVRGQCQRKLA